MIIRQEFVSQKRENSALLLLPLCVPSLLLHGTNERMLRILSEEWMRRKQASRERKQQANRNPLWDWTKPTPSTATGLDSLPPTSRSILLACSGGSKSYKKKEEECFPHSTVAVGKIPTSVQKHGLRVFPEFFSRRKINRDSNLDIISEWEEMEKLLSFRGYVLVCTYVVWPLTRNNS